MIDDVETHTNIIDNGKPIKQQNWEVKDIKNTNPQSDINGHIMLYSDGDMILTGRKDIDTMIMDYYHAVQYTKKKDPTIAGADIDTRL
ncbi:MAG: hypothetical protein NZZ41_02875 [Candidatus Dojkabacteria bacterium]|nr:hypothetical protein [Candidatus Dojkabacteria bacterium]